MEEHLVVLVDRRLLLALFRCRVAAVEEAVTVPRGAGHLHPFDRIRQGLFRGELHHLQLLPVRTAAGDAVDGVLRVFGRHERGERDRISPGVGIDQHLGRAAHPLLDVENALVLQPTVLSEEHVWSLSTRGRVLLVVVELLDAGP